MPCKVWEARRGKPWGSDSRFTTIRKGKWDRHNHPTPLTHQRMPTCGKQEELALKDFPELVIRVTGYHWQTRYSCVIRKGRRQIFNDDFSPNWRLFIWPRSWKGNFWNHFLTEIATISNLWKILGIRLSLKWPEIISFKLKIQRQRCRLDQASRT